MHLYEKWNRLVRFKSGLWDPCTFVARAKLWIAASNRGDDDDGAQVWLVTFCELWNEQGGEGYENEFKTHFRNKNIWLKSHLADWLNNVWDGIWNDWMGWENERLLLHLHWCYSLRLTCIMMYNAEEKVHLLRENDVLKEYAHTIKNTWESDGNGGSGIVSAGCYNGA